MNDAEQLLLWRWSTNVQLASLAMATAFFALLAANTRRGELRTWARAWFANFLALVVTAIYWLMLPLDLFVVIAPVYLATKMTFALLLIEGAWMMMNPGARLYSSWLLSVFVIVYSIGGTLWTDGIAALGIMQHSVMGVVLLAFAAVMGRRVTEALVWLAAAIGLRGALALLEAFAYSVQLSPPPAGMLARYAEPIALFVSASSLFDTAVEWLIVLGCVLAYADRTRRQLQDANHDLVMAQMDLRRLADRDPLTALVNRRSLPEIFRSVQPHGALLLFFDLDGFKQINDMHGHTTGDACLKTFAIALRESFRPDDHVIRYGGDEFLVVARGLDSAGARSRVDELEMRLARSTPTAVMIGFSVGMAELPPGGQPEAALEAADAQMYKAKHR
jgi:diguanylate cyclase (GGDEF)-like protein